MKRYSLRLQAGVPVEFDHPGRFFTLLNAISPVDVALQRVGHQAEVMEGMTAGLWADFGDEHFSRIRIVSQIDQHVAFLVSMVRSGWNAPPPSVEFYQLDAPNLAASGSVALPWIYLGDDFADVVLSASFAGVSSGGGQFGIQCCTDGAGTNLRNAVGQGYNGVANVSITGFVSIGSARPIFPWTRLVIINGSTIQSAGAMGHLIVMRNPSA
ncbi:hypothetical protein [Methyloversatilis discipulorum]|uniref:hypothetical protein n=1 Tax=Methyloversatilis discipulorum TaxID=1119528 RepID=UPI003F3C3F6F